MRKLDPASRKRLYDALAAAMLKEDAAVKWDLLFDLNGAFRVALYILAQVDEKHPRKGTLSDAHIVALVGAIMPYMRKYRENRNRVRERIEKILKAKWAWWEKEVSK